MATTRHRGLVERGRRKAFVRDKGFAHTQKGGNKRREKFQEKNRYPRIYQKNSSA